MLRTAARSRRWPGLLALVGAALLAVVAGCSPDAFLAGDDDRDRNLQRARDAERLGDFEGAAEYYERALDRHPRSPQVHLGYGLLCEVRLQRYADAVYHYQRYLRLLPPGDPKAEDIRRRVTNCTERLATRVPLVIRSETIARDLAAARRENDQLRVQITNQLTATLYWSNEVRRLVQLATTASFETSTSPPDRDRAASGAETSSSPPGRQRSNAGVRESSTPSRTATVRPRSHQIQRGETFSSISRRYRVDLGALRRANPHLNERRLRPGDWVRLP